jgi:hypothetical protein
MKVVYAAFLLSLVSFNISIGQNLNVADVFSNTHGLKQKDVTFYEVEGYEITVLNDKGNWDEKGISKLKRKYKIDKGSNGDMDSLFSLNRCFKRIEQRTPSVKQTGIYYFFPKGDGEILTISLQTLMSRDTLLEYFFVRFILNNSIPDFLYSSSVVDSIKFANRYIKLGPLCQWMGVHNVQCSSYGQMNWAEFRSLEKAQEMIATQLDVNLNNNLAKVLKQDTVSVVFEGVETNAIKLIYQFKIPEIIAGCNTFAVYFICCEVRGKYVGAVLSQCVYDIETKKLAPLLREVMSLKVE